MSNLQAFESCDGFCVCLGVNASTVQCVQHFVNCFVTDTFQDEDRRP